ncbi:MAG: HAD family hydrolase [Bacteroidia bacterium]|nr:HAD family hydrolase [Bacteroidia bacterium]
MLFVSDLDGTLLQNDATLSAFARKTLETMISQGVAFSVATARSITSSRLVLGDLKLDMPIICSNGAYIADFHSGEHRHVFSHPEASGKDLLGLVLSAGFHPFLGTFDGNANHLYMGEIANEGLSWYKKDREMAKDRRLKLVDDVSIGLRDHVISLNVIEREGPIRELGKKIEELFPGVFCHYVYENWYDESWFWLSLYHVNATKGHAIQTLIQEEGFELEDLAVFGDNLNDISMFEIAPKAIAMGNARKEIKDIAHEVIGTNETDAVVKYIAKSTGHAHLIT